MPTTSPHSHTLRKGRCSEPGRIYLLTAVVQNRRPIFSNLKLGRLLVAELRNETEMGKAESLAWVIMPDHLHWLIQLKSGNLDTLMREVKGRSAIAINREQHSQGKIWQPGYHDHALRNEDDLQETARYIVANPLRAGLVEKIGDYSLWDAVWLK